MNNNKRLLMLVEIAIFAAIGLILDKLTLSLWAQGGSISLVMLPIILMAFRWGLSSGLMTGLLIGVLQMIFGGYILHWAQALLDYVVAFSVVGFAAIVRKQILEAAREVKKTKISVYIVIGTLIGGFLRYLAHTIGGVIFFAEYAGDQNVWIYSIVYNASYMLPATIITAVVGALIFSAAPRLLKTK
ncbi:energy-coupled thiamine transporter ThiT [Ureibacillus composti]|nr:energy-coupled thiamine transporter ThiT [Ureibacillus composti]